MSKRVADVLGEQSKYILNRGLETDFYVQWVVRRLSMSPCRRAELEQLLLGKLPDVLTGEQKRNKVKNLLAAMSRGGLITTDGKRGPTAIWRVLPAGLDRLPVQSKT